jgi:hypothetical protein
LYFESSQWWTEQNFSLCKISYLRYFIVATESWLQAHVIPLGPPRWTKMLSPI